MRDGRSAAIGRSWLVLATLSCAAPTTRPPPPAAVSPRAAVERPLVVGDVPPVPEGRLPHTFEPTRYAARLRVDPAIATFSGTIEITGELSEPSTVIWLHAEGLTVHRVSASRGSADVRLAAAMPEVGILALQSERALAAGTWTLSIAYSGAWNDGDSIGGFRQTFDAEHYVFTQFQPDFARRMFPCVDEPDRKVPWQLTIEAPEALVVASNMPIEAEHSGAASTMKTVRFAPTLPLSSYLVAFAVGPFDVVEARPSKNGVPIRILALPEHAAYARHAAGPAAELLDNLETWLGVPFAYPKLDLVAVPKTTWWIAMENAGLVTFNADLLRSPERWNRTTRHELAHHWFGNLVTPAWWDDLWLSESFAYWLGKGRERHRIEHKDAAACTPARSYFGGRRQSSTDRHISIDRGEAVLQHLERYLGAERFVTALRAYLRNHAHANARTSDLLRALAEAGGDAALASTAETYLTRSELATLRFELRCTERANRLEVRGLEQPALVCLAYDHDGARRDHCATVAPSAPSIELATRRCPRWVMPSTLEPIAWQPAELAALRDHGWSALSPDEQLELAQHAVDANAKHPALRWSYIAKLATSHDATVLAWLASYLASVDHAVPPTLRARYDDWLVETLGPRARSLGLVPHDGDDEAAAQLRSSPLLPLLGAAGDRALRTEALALLPRLRELDTEEQVRVLQIAVHARPAIVDDLIEDLPASSRWPDHAAEAALASVRDPLALFARHRDAVGKLGVRTVERLLVRVCDATRRAEVEELAKHSLEGHTPPAFEACVGQRAQLESELRGFLRRTRHQRLQGRP